MIRCKYPIVLFYLLFFMTIWTVNLGITIVSMFSYIFILCMAMLCSVETNITLLFCLFPIQRIFMLSTSFMTVVPMISALIILKSFLEYRISKRCEKQLIAAIILLFFSSLVEYIRFSTISKSIEYILMVILILVVCEVINGQLRRACMYVYCFSSILSAITGYFLPAVSSYTAIFTMEYNPRFQGIMGDPGEFGQTMVCAMAMVLALYIINKRQSNFLKDSKRKNRFYLLYVVSFFAISFFFIVLSGTRASLIGIAVIYIFVMYNLFKTKSRMVQISALVLGFISILTLGFVASYLFNILSASHGGESLSQDLRLSIWTSYMQAIWRNPDIILFGVGMNSCGIFGTVMGMGNPHNIIIEKVVECGLVGFIINFSIFYPIIKRKKMGLSVPETLPFYVLLSTLMVYGSSGLELPYLLLALIYEKREAFTYDCEKNISDVNKSNHAIC